MSSLTGIESAVLAFDAVQSELAIATGDGRVRLFAVNQQRLTADITQELTAAVGGKVATEVYSCMAWGGKGNSQRLLIVGSFTGAVRCYDAARAEVRWSAASPVDGSIAALAASTDGSGAVLVVGKTGGAALLDISTGNVLSRWHASKHALSAAAILPGGGALVAGSSLTLHDASSGARLHKWTGHATLVKALAVTPDGSFCCSAAQGERSIAVWSTATTAAGKLRHKSAIAQLNLEEPAVGISVGGAPGGVFHVAAVTASGGLRLFQWNASADGNGAATRQWATSSPSSGRVLCAAIDTADSTGANFVLASGSTAKPHFQKTRADVGSEGAAPTVIEVVQGEAGLLLGGKSDAAASGTKSKGQSDTAIVGADAAVVLAGKAGAKRGAGDAGLTGDDDVVQDDDIMDDVDTDEEDQDAGPTFAERIAALQESNGGVGGVASAPPPAPSGPLKADSLAVLLSQALQSGDKVLLERCLDVRNEDIITKTVRRLAPADAAAFLQAAVQRLQSAPTRGDQLATWIRAVLLYHTAYLSGVSGSKGTLGYLYQLIETRLASYQPLLALSGRLDLVLANAKRAAGGTGGDDDDIPGTGGPLVTVEVGSDGGVEVEDAFAAGGLSDSEDSLGEYSEEEDSEDDAEEIDDGEESEEY